MKIKDPITTIEAAAILGLDASAIRHRILVGTLIAEKRGRDNYVSRRVIESEKEERNGKSNGSGRESKRG